MILSFLTHTNSPSYFFLTKKYWMQVFGIKTVDPRVDSEKKEEAARRRRRSKKGKTAGKF